MKWLSRPIRSLFGRPHSRSAESAADLDTPVLGFRQPLSAGAQTPGDTGAVPGGAAAPAVLNGTLEEARWPGSARPLAGGAAPTEEFTVKANEGSMRFYTAESPHFGMVQADLWFRSEADALRAGFTPAPAR